MYKQKVSDATVSSKQEDAKGGFVAAAWLPSQGEVMCVTADQRLLFYTSDTQENDEKDLKLARRLIGYNEEIIDLKFLGDGDSSLAVATNLEQVSVVYTCLFIFQAHFPPEVCCMLTSTNSCARSLVSTCSLCSYMSRS